MELVNSYLFKDKSFEKIFNKSYKMAGFIWFLYLMIYQPFLSYFNAKSIHVEEQHWYYLTNSLKDNRFHAFPKGIHLKVNRIVWFKF